MWEAEATNRDKKEHEAIREIKENGQLLLQVVNNILEAARLEAGRQELSLEEVDIFDLYSAVQDSVGFIAEKRNLSFSTRVDSSVPIFMGDWGKLRRILENLAGNAIKFTARGGSVCVKAIYDAANATLIMQVCDTGIGIKEEDLPFIFDRFIQNDFSSYRRYSGSGLGLAVVKDLVAMLGGTIEVQSTYHKGSVFTVRIPISPVEAEQEGGTDNEDNVSG
jgi:signal transduction histidine kinase